MLSRIQRRLGLVLTCHQLINKYQNPSPFTWGVITNVPKVAEAGARTNEGNNDQVAVQQRESNMISTYVETHAIEGYPS